MKSPFVKTLIVLFAVLAVAALFATDVAAQVNAMSGKAKMTYTKREVVPVGDFEGHIFMLGDANGINANTGKWAFMDGAKTRSVGFQELTKGNGPQTGYLILSKDGSETVAKITGTIKTAPSTPALTFLLPRRMRNHTFPRSPAPPTQSRRPGMKVKWRSYVMVSAPCSIACAAIQTSLIGIGVPARRKRSLMRLKISAVSRVASMTITEGFPINASRRFRFSRSLRPPRNPAQSSPRTNIDMKTSEASAMASRTASSPPRSAA